MSFTIFQNEKTGFQAIKTRSSNSRKIDIFPKGLTHRFRPKMAISPKIVLQAIQPRKISFTVFQIEKTAFQAIKTRNSKSRKIDIFPWFWSKSAHFSNFFCLGNIRQENVFYDTLERKNAFLGYIKNKVQNVEKLTFFQKSKNGHLSNFFFSAIQARKIYFTIFQNEKTPFLFLQPRKAFFRFRISQKTFTWPILPKKKVKKWPFLDKNHGLTPFLKNVSFSTF